MCQSRVCPTLPENTIVLQHEHVALGPGPSWRAIACPSPLSTSTRLAS